MVKFSINHLGLIIGAAVALAMYIHYGNWVMIEVGIITFVLDVFWELRGTGKGWWKYDKSPIFNIAGRVPIEIPLTFFFLGIWAVGIVLFTLGT
jgi:uncharacterized membrane protein